MFFTLDRGGLESTAPFGRFFANSIYFVGGVALLCALFMLWRPVLLRGEPATPEERSLLRENYYPTWLFVPRSFLFVTR